MVPHAQEPADTGSATPGLRAVWPGLGLLLLLGTIAYLAVPSVRQQAELSLSRQDTPFVELSAVPLDDASHVGTTCQEGRQPGTTAVVVAFRSHLRDRETLRYQVSVTRPEADDAPFGQRGYGKVNIDPGVLRTVTEDVAVPRRGAFDVEVRLPATDQYLLLHCDPQGEVAP